ncbi:MAG: hypothetical protein V1904_04085 [Bacteroidota bacterium]
MKSCDTTHLLLLIPEDFIFIKQNQSLADEKQGKDGSDSASLAASFFLDEIKDTLISGLIYSNFESILKSGPFKVYGDDEMSRFMHLGTKSYIIRIAQIELDEFIIPYTASEQFDTLTYYEDFNLNAVSVNMWMEVTEVNGTQDTSQVLYSKEQISDVVEGYFTKSFSGMVKYVYQRTDINLDNIYKMSTDFGEMNAHYLFDYFMNKYIHERYKGNKAPKYYHFDGATGNIYPAGYYRFIFL